MSDKKNKEQVDTVQPETHEEGQEHNGEGTVTPTPTPPTPPAERPEEHVTPSTKLELKNIHAIAVSKSISISSVIKLAQLQGDMEENYKQASILAYSNSLTIDEAIEYMVYTSNK